MIRNELWLGLFRWVPKRNLVLIMTRVMNSFFFNSNDSLTEFVRSKHKASPLTKPFLTLGGWHEEKYNACIGMFLLAYECVWTSSILPWMNRDPLQTSVSRKTICFDDISCANLMVAWKEFAKLIKSVSEIVHTGNMSSINLSQTNAL